MEDKKVKAGNVAIGICLFVIAILLVLIVIVFYNATMEKNNLQAQIDELETEIEKKDEVFNNSEENNKIKEIIVEGDYAIENSDIFYKFYEDGKVESSGNIHVSEGIYYTIGENKIELKFTKSTICEDDLDELIVKNINEIYTATIKDENTLLIEGEAHGEKYEYEIVKYIKNDKNNIGDNKTNDNIDTDNNDLKTYNIDLNSFEASETDFKDVNYGDYSFSFNSNGEVSIYLGFGTCGSGKYTIKDDLIYCELTRWLGQSGGFIEYETEPVKINLIRKNEKCLEIKEAEGNVKVTKIIESNFENGSAIELGKKIDFFELDEAFANNAKFILEE